MADPRAETNARPPVVQWPSVAYFSMEIALDPAIPTYSGGLGILAGDTLRAAADLGVPMVGMTLLYRKGYFRQRLDRHGNQTEEPNSWAPGERLEPLAPRVTVSIEGRLVRMRAWRFLMRGVGGFGLPVYLLDTDLPENDPGDRAITDHLYGGDERYRLCQEAVLGFGGVALLRALGHRAVQCYHLNEGHSAFVTLALLRERTEGRPLQDVTKEDVEAVRARCTFTTHTPIPAGHDVFSMEVVRRVLGEETVTVLENTGLCSNGVLNMTALALGFSHYCNGVSLRHRATAQSMFPGYPIESVTNGVHAATWLSAPFQRLYDRHCPQWRGNNPYLRNAINIPTSEVLRAHQEAKREMLSEVEQRSGVRLDPQVMTIGFARRATPYKRSNLVFADLERLRHIVRQVGPIQFIFAGKSHLRDEGGKALIRQVFQAADALRDAVPVVYVEDYDMALARYLCSGVDLWLNTPQPPQEASGTSGMKAALNGVPSLSTLDGWWREGHREGVTGWAIEDGPAAEQEIASLYDKLERVIVPMFYERPDAYAQVMRSAIALNGSYFNAQRMLVQYLVNAYTDNLLPWVSEAESSGEKAHVMSRTL